MNDAFVRKAFNEIVYHLQTKLGTELSPDMKHDILSNIEKPVAYYKGLYEEHRQTTVQFNSLMIQLRQAGIYKNWVK